VTYIPQEAFFFKKLPLSFKGSVDAFALRLNFAIFVVIGEYIAFLFADGLAVVVIAASSHKLSPQSLQAA
jgi:putative Ca2+/H+ antiporter (TMEM165/GDT1 family)